MVQNIDLKQAKKAVSALFKYNKSQSNNDMLGNDEENGIYIEIRTHKIMNKESLKKKKVALPFTPYAETIEICYITKDEEKTIEEKLKKESITEIKKVVNVKTLATTYKAYEARRKLADSYDMFLVDDRIAHLMPNLVGKKFFEKNKNPIAIKATGSLKKQVESALKATYVKLHNNLTTHVLIGNFGMDEKDVLKNYEVGLPNIVNIAAHDWEQVQLIGIKSKASPLLPVYTAFPKEEPVPEKEETTETKKTTKSTKKTAEPTKKTAELVKKEETVKKQAAAKAATAKQEVKKQPAKKNASDAKEEIKKQAAKKVTKKQPEASKRKVTKNKK
ncbi:ribosomal protein L1p/L10e family-domain-containing protein [Gilbertella persicaria]|uniref:ribosomal protein L1p/L10e family-domain-containing protein n=1 Tax=Gilbertella persicaria TaxID=101096 RepID=UPI00221F6427|nr:ribosomal protein L1p/L10e family-domain-containing protein [Gilbertella persicaria]KAI8058702.1 ribosomal protein L1p/L10e family-domain-containing protein [Gilbertella persicaria]